MDFNLSREHQLVRKMMAEFTENEVKPIAAETDKTSQYPRENIEKLFNLGVMGMCVPKEYGGAGADPLASAICIEELSKQCASTGDIVATHNGLCCDPILTHGTDEQKAKYLPMLTTGRKVGAFALTEPNAGSDASKTQTTAVLEGDHYVMNGSKIFITNGYVADVFVVFAMTDKSKGTKGISAFIVESSFPGFSVGKHEEKMGLHGSPTAEIVFTDMIVPKENMLGREGKGFNIVALSFDNKLENWTKAIEDMQMPWIHLSDLKGWKTVAGQIYGVNAIPASFLVDPNGTIIAADLRGEKLEAKLKEVYGE